jgi:hypothetical protein
MSVKTDSQGVTYPWTSGIKPPWASRRNEEMDGPHADYAAFCVWFDEQEERCGVGEKYGDEQIRHAIGTGAGTDLYLIFASLFDCQKESEAR